ncbi:MAG: aldehyde dehydrogenase family protein [Acidimicrobiia bacterium]
MDVAALVEEEIGRARAAFATGRTRSIRWRNHQLEGLIAMLRTEEPKLIEAMAADLRKPPFEGWATDIGALISEFKHIRKHLERHIRPRRVSVPLFMKPGTAEIRLEPLGVVAVLAPWNYPLNLALSPLAAAVAAGNAVVLKPSELSEATSAALAEILPRYVDDEAVRVLTGGPEVATELLRHPLDHIFFTGGPGVARKVMAAAAVHLTPVTLELGGKSPTIVDQSADLAVTARRIAQGKLINAGQTCIAPDYVLVPRPLRDELVDQLDRAFKVMTKSDARTSTSYGRIISERHHDRVVGLIPIDKVASGGNHDHFDRFIEPTVVVDPEHDSPLMTEEIFGPVLAVVSVDDIDDAIAFVNARPKPLVLYVFSEDDDVTERILARTSSGGVGVNQTMYHAGVPGLPFGGVGESGHGRYRGLTGVDRLSNPKSILDRPMKPDLRLAYPPYGRISSRIMRKLI